MKNVIQFRYYGDYEASEQQNKTNSVLNRDILNNFTLGDYKNYKIGSKKSDNTYPNDLSLLQLKSSSFFSKYYPIKNIEIHSFPGLKFYVNNRPFILGNTGIYKNDNSNINNIYFDEGSLQIINSEDNLFPLIINIIY